MQRAAAVKIFATLSIAAVALSASFGAASAEDRPVTVYMGAGSITLPASALSPSQPVRNAAAPVAPARKIRIVLASPYRALN